VSRKLLFILMSLWGGISSLQGQLLETPEDVDVLVPAVDTGKPVVAPSTAPKDTGKTFAQDNPFTVFGKDQTTRSTVFAIANETREETLKSLKFGLVKKDADTVSPIRVPWKYPITIHLSPTLATPTQETQSKVQELPDGTLLLVINVAAGSGIPIPALREQVVRQVLTDYMLRGLTAEQLEKMETLTVPDWLLQGTLELMASRKLGRPSDLFESVFHLGKTLTVEEILNADVSGLDAVTLSIYRVSACALLQVLLDHPEGSLRLETMLGLLPRTQNAMVAVEATFPQLRGQKNSLEKWWSLQLAASAQPGKSELLGMEESEQNIAAALTVLVPKAELPATQPKNGLLGKLGGLFSKDKPETKEAKTPQPPAEPPTPVALEDFKTFLDRKDRAELLRPNNLALTALLSRVHPFYRRVVRDYITMVAELTEGKTRNLAAKLATAKKQRALMLKEAQETEDFIDQYEATEHPVESGKFREYLKAADEIERRGSSALPEIADYLDMMEREYSPL
jgi:hypothetical protein